MAPKSLNDLAPLAFINPTEYRRLYALQFGGDDTRAPAPIETLPGRRIIEHARDRARDEWWLEKSREAASAAARMHAQFLHAALTSPSREPAREEVLPFPDAPTWRGRLFNGLTLLYHAIYDVARYVSKERLMDTGSGARKPMKRGDKIAGLAVIAAALGAGGVGLYYLAIRDNQAIGWSMIMMVEIFVRGDGGVGVMIQDAQKYLRYDDVGALVFAILGFGILIDWLLGVGAEVLCPYMPRPNLDRLKRGVTWLST